MIDIFFKDNEVAHLIWQLELITSLLILYIDRMAGAVSRSGTELRIGALYKQRSYGRSVIHLSTLDFYGRL